MSGMPALQQSLYPASVKSKGNAWHALCVLHNLYFYNTMMEEIRDALDAGNCFLQRRKTVPDGTVKYKKCLKKPKRLAQRTEVV